MELINNDIFHHLTFQHSFSFQNITHIYKVLHDITEELVRMGSLTAPRIWHYHCHKDNLHAYHNHAYSFASLVFSVSVNLDPCMWFLPFFPNQQREELAFKGGLYNYYYYCNPVTSHHLLLHVHLQKITLVYLYNIQNLLEHHMHPYDINKEVAP